MLYSQETSQQLERPLNVLTRVLFSGDTGMFKAVQDSLYLYIPLLTMGLMSRETSSGSIKLLLSSPVRLRQIVFGKFFAMMIYSLLLVAILFCYLIAAYISVENLDVKFVLGGILGLYLLVCAYSAIGLFMSSLTSYQVVAAISTLAVLAALNFIGEVGQGYDIIRDITYWISISGRTETIINGLITSRDIIYFILIIVLFLLLTVMKLNNGREHRSSAAKSLRYFVLAFAIIVIGYVSSLPAFMGYYDTTRIKDQTFSTNSQEVLKRINKPVSITTYVNVIDYRALYGAPKNRIADISQFENFQRFLPELKMDYVYYYDTLMYRDDTTKTLIEKAKNKAEANGFNFQKVLDPAQIKRKINLIPEENHLVRMLSYNGKQTPLRMYDDMFVYPKEAEIIAALKRLLDGPGLVGVLKGNNERSTDKNDDKSYKAITKGLGTRGSLTNNGFEILDVSLQNTNDIPTDLVVLIIADPKSEYSPDEIQKIQKYVDSGGNLIIAGEPGRQGILNPIIQPLGISFINGTLLQESDNFDLDLIQASFTEGAKQLGLSFYDKAVVTFPGATGLSLSEKSNFKMRPLLIAGNNKTWIKNGDFDLSTQKVAFNPKMEKKENVPVAVALSRKLKNKEQKILITSDADFMSNVELNRFNLNTVNSSFVIRMFKWFSNGEYPVSINKEPAIDKKIVVSRAEINWLKVIFFAIIPGLIGVFGAVTLIIRKGK
ncbi:hypothetical protein ADIARSV_0535 [Arcticibacter svalbardensis MN12-7]|uniref:ABC-type uncharacterized transport system domain-containing protein n=2 Tax=Arcticibacter TaxID=1288026 RepID=R9GXS2_9SPHI|nr:hypothetical protein ADIARSV_0535 [Arcticibacter svalbardensis MN12-7]